MHFIESLCPPALFYLIYIAVHLGLDLSLGMFVTAAMKVVMGVAGVVILDALCSVDLGIVSWAIIGTPFIIVALATSISLGLNLDRNMATLVKESFWGGPVKDKVPSQADDLPAPSAAAF